MRILSASSTFGLARWYPPRPTIETISPVWPSLRWGICPLTSPACMLEGTPASIEAPVAISRNRLLSTVESSIMLSLRRGCQGGLRPQNLAEQKQIGKQSAEMNRRVQVVDQLRADGGLGQNQIQRGERVARVAVQHRPECLVSHRRPADFCEAVQRVHGATEEFTNLWAALIARQPPRGISQHELVAFFNSFTTFQDLGQHCQRFLFASCCRAPGVVKW